MLTPGDFSFESLIDPIFLSSNIASLPSDLERAKILGISQVRRILSLAIVDVARGEKMEACFSGDSCIYLNNIMHTLSISSDYSVVLKEKEGKKEGKGETGQPIARIETAPRDWENMQEVIHLPKPIKLPLEPLRKLFLSARETLESKLDESVSLVSAKHNGSHVAKELGKLVRQTIRPFDPELAAEVDILVLGPKKSLCVSDDSSQASLKTSTENSKHPNARNFGRLSICHMFDTPLMKTANHCLPHDAALLIAPEETLTIPSIFLESHGVKFNYELVFIIPLWGIGRSPRDWDSDEFRLVLSCRQSLGMRLMIVAARLKNNEELKRAFVRMAPAIVRMVEKATFTRKVEEAMDLEAQDQKLILRSESKIKKILDLFNPNA